MINNRHRLSRSLGGGTLVNVLTVALLEKNPSEADFGYLYDITKCKVGRKHAVAY